MTPLSGVCAFYHDLALAGFHNEAVKLLSANQFAVVVLIGDAHEEPFGEVL